MSRHLRNFLFFALAFTLTVLAGFASAANIKLSGPNSIGQSGSSYLRGDGNPTTTFTKSSTPAPSEVLSDSKVLMKRVFDVAGETANGPWSGVIIDAMEVPKSTLGSVLKGAVKNGLKPGGIIGGLVIGLATDWMINKGYQWMNDSSAWMKNQPPEHPGRYQYTPTGRFDTAENLKNWICQSYLGRNDCYFTNYEKFPYLGISYPGYLPGYSAKGIVYVDNSMGMTGTLVAASPADLDATMDDLATQKLKDVADAFMNDASTLPIPDDAKTTPTGGPYTTPIRDLGTTTTNNPDGSRKVENKQSQDSVKPEGGATPAAPINFKTENITTTTTNNYNIDNTVTTTTSVSTKSGSGTDDSKTDCDKHPESVGCAALGSAPDAPDIGQQTVSPTFSWSPFSLPITCPQPQTISTSRGTYSMSWQPECDFAAKLAPLVIAFAGLAALYLAFGMKNDG